MNCCVGEIRIIISNRNSIPLFLGAGVIYACKAGAIIERRPTNRSNAIADCYACKARAIIERRTPIVAKQNLSHILNRMQKWECEFLPK